eukprot:TRINITY_DN81461_c0_g1_i1.p1 TRINITY_DN81461_c0_g1~~TRINITY_DN81461_c0_g1_i1.p1  ORF type:complete len:151 (+),score=28.93 TRINITY_DN81461_c0_g1_i1:60-512(+)
MAYLVSAIVAMLSVPAMSAHCTYPGGECYELKMQKCEGHTQYTMHGLWAEWDNGCHGPAYDKDAISSIRSKMEEVWPSCFGHSNDDFWSHEWEKHGTCSGMGQAEFFQKALDLYDEYVSQCGDTEECQVCFSRDFSTQETCPSGAESVLV